MAMPRVILFTGAPSVASVNLDSCTLNRFSEPFNRVMGLQDERASQLSSQQSHAVWRSLPLSRQPLRTGFSQSRLVEFFTASDATPDGDTRSFDGHDGEAILTQFCEESLAAHTSASFSQMDSVDVDTTEETSLMTTPSAENAALGPPGPRRLSDLREIPSASRIIALSPQTVTLNIIVAVISIAQPRTVTTRWGKALSLVEVLVGDETKSAFAVTFWLSGDQVTSSHVRKLRRQDVVLMENVALHVFRGKVYGQSLRKNLTKVSLLWRRDGGGYYAAKHLTRRTASRHPQQEKTRQVKDWVIRFVGRDPSTRRPGSKVPRKSWDRPPDDTQ